MTGLEPASWHEFALGQLGASAALLGLVFVGISINLQNVLGSRRLVNRAAEAVLLLAGILLGSTAVLVPEQPNRALGVELVVLGAATFAAVLMLQRSMGQVAEAVATEGSFDAGDSTEPVVAHLLRRVFGAGACLLVLVAGISLLADGGGGLYWWVGAVVLAYAGALVSVWVLMIEILR